MAISDVRQALQTLNIVESQSKLVWVARFYVILPLPDGWQRAPPEYDTDCFMNSITKEKLNVKPCYYYIIRLLQIVKKHPDRDRLWNIWMAEGDHIFEDGFEKLMLISNENLFHVGKSELVENKQEKAQYVIAKETEKTNKFTHPILEKCNVFLKNPSKFFRANSKTYKTATFLKYANR